ncbi:MAG: glycerol-3-phosphate dehydrogenase subunit GlpB [Desulfobacterales bacterium]|nr:MAG: glycerol-3-phosphate dehydrogenase subunit GlpB [Desulfobacterales bacterium]
MTDPKIIECDLLVIGTGMAGSAAALFAANRGVSVVQVGIISEIIFASGLLDLMGVHPIQKQRIWDNPWAAIDTVSKDIPGHPYAKLNEKDIRNAFAETLSFFTSAGIRYSSYKNRNVRVLTPVGTIKPTYCVPHTMWAGVKALEDQQPCLIVDIHGLKGFNARQITVMVKQYWPGIHSASIAFPDTGHLSEVYPEQMARALELASNREKLAKVIRPFVKDYHVVGVPAILGLYHTQDILNDLQEKIGVPIFEIPTMPPSVTGLRIKEAFEKYLPKIGVRLFTQKRVLDVDTIDSGKRFVSKVGDDKIHFKVLAQGIILASGRFIGKGLHADRKQIHETIFDLPVYQTGDRSRWHLKDFLDSRGHPINRAGLETDHLFRPFDRSGHPAFQRLFAIGSILAHQDWIRMKCGSGLAIATAYKAVNAFIDMIDAQ